MKEMAIIKESCPYCKCSNVIKYGKFNNNQRYKCKICNRTFCDSTNTIWYYSKKNKELWVKYIQLLSMGGTLRFTAASLKISVTSAFYWRHKILNGIEKNEDGIRFKDSVCMAKRMNFVSYKGEKGKLVCNKHWSEREKVWIMFCGDIHNNSLSRPTAFRYWDKKYFEKTILDRVDDGVYIDALSDNYVVNIAKKHNENIKVNKNEESKCLVNTYIEVFRKVHSMYRGVASKYLTRYLSFIKLFIIEGKNIINYIFKICSDNSMYIKKDIIPCAKILDKE